MREKIISSRFETLMFPVQYTTGTPPSDEISFQFELPVTQLNEVYFRRLSISGVAFQNLQNVLSDFAYSVILFTPTAPTNWLQTLHGNPTMSQGIVSPNGQFIGATHRKDWVGRLKMRRPSDLIFAGVWWDNTGLLAGGDVSFSICLEIEIL